MSLKQQFISKIKDAFNKFPTEPSIELNSRITKEISKDVLKSIFLYDFDNIATDILQKVSNIIDDMVANNPKKLSKYIVPDNPKNVKMSVIKQCARRVNRLIGSSMSASSMKFIDSYKRLDDGTDVLVYSYVIVLKGFCKSSSFSKTYNLIIDSDKIDKNVLRCFHGEIIKHYQKEMSKKYPQLLGKISYDECLGTLTGTVKRALESIEGKLEGELEKDKPEIVEDIMELPLRKWPKKPKQETKQCLNPLDYEFRDENEYEYFIHLPIDLQIEYARTHLKIRSKDYKNIESETVKMTTSEEYHVRNVYESTLDTSFIF